jgi:hypothetical protein
LVGPFCRPQGLPLSVSITSGRPYLSKTRVYRSRTVASHSSAQACAPSR